MLATFAVWLATGYDPLLVLVPLQLFQMVHQLLPFVRLDGYHILADLVGVPDLFGRIRPTLASLVPGRQSDRRVEALKPWVRVVITAWVVTVVPLLLFALNMVAIGLPRILATGWDSMGRQWDSVTAAFGDRKVVSGVTGLVATAAVALPMLSVVFMLGRLAHRLGRAAWRRTEDRPVAQLLLAPAGALVLAGLAWRWWPNGEYEPIRPRERWTVQEGVAATQEISTGRPGLTEQRAEALPAAERRSPPRSSGARRRRATSGRRSSTRWSSRRAHPATRIVAAAGRASSTSWSGSATARRGR